MTMSVQPGIMCTVAPDDLPDLQREAEHDGGAMHSIINKGRAWRVLVSFPAIALLCTSSAHAQEGTCLPGMTIVEVGKCCWPNQDWVAAKQMCRGVPVCPSGYTVQGEACIAAQDEVAPPQAIQPVPPPVAAPVRMPVQSMQQPEAARVAPRTEASPPANTSEPAKGIELRRSPGTMQVGGPVSFSINQGTINSGYGASSTRDGYVIRIEPDFGIFVATGLELMVSFAYELSLGDLYTESSEATLGGSLGVRYVFGWSGARINPYVRVAVGPLVVLPDTGVNATYFSVTGQLGLLVPLGSNMALDFGVAATNRTLLEGDPAHYYESLNFFPAGFFGYTALF